MKKLYYILSIVLCCGCSNSQTNSSDFNNIQSKEIELNGIRIGDNLEKLKDRFKGDIIIQKYSDITELKECQNRKNILVNNTLTSVDVNNDGIVTSIHTRDEKIVDSNNISVGKTEINVTKLNTNVKPQKVFSGDDSLDLFLYKIPMKKSKGYFIYNIDNNKIESISIESFDHISCNLE